MKNPTEYAAELLAMFNGDKLTAYNAFIAGLETPMVGMSRPWCCAVVKALFTEGAR
jgi:hypothetical protein